MVTPPRGASHGVSLAASALPVSKVTALFFAPPKPVPFPLPVWGDTRALYRPEISSPRGLGFDTQPRRSHVSEEGAFFYSCGIGRDPG